MERREPLYTVGENVNWYSYCGEHFQFSSSVVSNSLHPHRLQHGRPSMSIANSWRSLKIMSIKSVCHPTISSSVVPFSSCLQSFPSIWVFSSESVLCIRWPKYWSFSISISSSNEYSGLIFFRMDCFVLFAVQETLKRILPHHH